ncbi:uncharacterized protein LOC101487942 [Maylandia zebra]|uniref:uncharacterized protein LOC101487942 n=1 Tax=Maylandia zebra TaxID=106582 RepID=UPI00403D01D5
MPPSANVDAACDSLHSVVSRLPSQLCRDPPDTRTVQSWLEEGDEALKDCFESTMWKAICDDHGEDIDSRHASNTVLPTVMKDTLENSGVDHHLTTCILDYLTGRLQYVRTQDCWISVLAFEFHSVEVQPGEEVTLQCSNLSSYPVHLFWFRSTNRPNASRISSMYSPEGNVTFYEGFQNGKFSMTSNISVLFLEIKQVDLSDSGLYFCGQPSSEKSIVYGATNLKVHEGRSQNPSTMILGSLTVFLLLVITGLIVKIRKFHTAQDDGQNPQRSENVDSGAMNYAALSFPLRAKIRRSAPQRELETNVVYSATR